MQDIVEPLTIKDFEKDSVLVISKVEIDSDGAGTFKELLDVKTYNISINEENRTAKFCSYSFNITCLNINDRYNPLNLGSDCPGWLKQGRKIRLWAGIKKDETPHPYQLILGRIDDFKLNKRSGKDICTISGRCLMRMIQDFKLYYPNTYWGTDILYDTVANQIRYNMEADCEGIYKVELDYTEKNGDALEEIFENSDWTYDWHSVPNQLVFTPQRIPDFAGTGNLKVYYFQTQDVEDVVADILLAAGIFADEAAKNIWLTSEHCTVTDKKIKRVWFVPGTSASKAITLLAEVVQYRFYFDYAGNPIFKPKPDMESPVNLISDYEAKTKNIEENVEEVFTHIIVIGEERDRVLGDDEIAPSEPTGLELTTGFGETNQAGLAWIKAEWDANTESDFGHYELRIRKTGDPDYDYTEVSTIATSYIWYGLESGVTYSVEIRAVDIYNNRSDWSAIETILTATDGTAPAQITGVEVEAIFAGIKVKWQRATEDNVAGYIVERQESDDGEEWTGDWVERVRLRATMWLDLMLSYSKWYRYKITAYTQADVLGATSVISDVVQPKQAATIDIEALAITASKIAADAVTEIKIAANAVTEGKIMANAVVADKISAGAVGTEELAALSIIAGKIAASAITTAKIKAGAITTDCIAADAVTAAKIYANTITANEIAAGTINTSELAAYAVTAIKIAADAITTDKIKANAVTTTELNFTPVKSTDVIARINASAEGIDIQADNIAISGSTTFSSGYNHTGKIATGKAAADVNSHTTTIHGGKITTYSITAVRIASNAITAAKIQTGAVTTTKLNFTPVKSTDVIARINASPEGLRIGADNIYISGYTSFASGYNPAQKLSAGQAANDVNAHTTTIHGGKITTGSITANKLDVSTLSAISADIGTITAGTISGVRFRVGAGTNEDIYFEDSGIRMYDAGSYLIRCVGQCTLNLVTQSAAGGIVTSANILMLSNNYKDLFFHKGGTLQLPTLTSAPTGHTGDLAFDNGDEQTKLYTQGAWRHHSTYAGW